MRPDNGRPGKSDKKRLEEAAADVLRGGSYGAAVLQHKVARTTIFNYAAKNNIVSKNYEKSAIKRS